MNCIMIRRENNFVFNMPCKSKDEENVVFYRVIFSSIRRSFSGGKRKGIHPIAFVKKKISFEDTMSSCSVLKEYKYNLCSEEGFSRSVPSKITVF